MSDPQQRCSHCILPATPPVIHLDPAGKCNYCHAFQAKYISLPPETAATRQADFESLLQSSTRKHRSYDCLVPVSGGKDSMYVLYACSRTYNLRVLAFTFDNGFSSPSATANIEKAIKILNVDFIRFKPSEAVLFKLYRTFLLRTGEFCAPCNMLIGETSLKYARENNIPLIITGGGGRWSAAISGLSISKYANLPFYYNVINGYIDPRETSHLIRRNYARVDWKKITGFGTNIVSFFDHVNPLKEQLYETLKSELEWELPPGGLEHGDCLVNGVKDYIVRNRWGFSEVTGGYAALVRNGRMSRRGAISMAERDERRDVSVVRGEFLGKIGVTEEEFRRATKERHFTDFSNEYGRLYRARRRIVDALR